ncbi:MAG: tRNA adenosine deaminase-associated protein [Nocardioides sp.]|uniref:tRNA adenosine deaminase-associated protein n=1 Tax=Nocardioides sp. TaxID=35761 RepID=UPI0039E2E6C2
MVTGGGAAGEADGVDFALAAYREEGVWQVAELAHSLLDDVDSIAGALRRFPGDGGAVGLIGVDEDFFIVCRVVGSTVRLLLSDVTAAEDWALAESVVDFLGLPDPDDDEDVAPAGDLGIFADLGFSAMEMGALIDELLDDDELYPDEVLSEIARSVGFGELFDDAVGLTNA